MVTRYLHLNEGNFPSIAERDRLLYWFVHAGMWGRFSGSTETKPAQDYERLNTSGLDGIIRGLALTRGGELRVNPEDFTGYSMGSRFYPMLYLLTRVHAARDFGSGLELRAQLLGKSSGLEVHHIFPKAVLYKAGYSRGEVNAIANFAFLTKSSNQSILAKEPAEYLAKIAQELPGVLESQWVPTDPELWRIDRYPDFLQERRRLLADAANHFLESLREGTLAAGGLHRLAPAVESEPDESSVRIDQLVVKLRPFAVVDPLRDHPILDPTNDQLLAMADAWWPDGLQVGRGEPTGLILDPDGEDIERLQALGYRVFTPSLPSLSTSDEKPLTTLEMRLTTSPDGPSCEHIPAPLGWVGSSSWATGVIRPSDRPHSSALWVSPSLPRPARRYSNASPRRRSNMATSVPCAPSYVWNSSSSKYECDSADFPPAAGRQSGAGRGPASRR